MKRILVIEDEQHLCKQIATILQAEGFDVIRTTSAAEGIDFARQQSPDLIVCDILMPDLSGYDVLNALQADINTAMIPFVFLSAKANHSDIREGMNLGADDYLTKPFSAQELLEAIAARLKKQEKLVNRVQVLCQQLKNLESLIEAKENLLENLTQELRRPLSNVNMAIMMLEANSPQERRQYYLQILKDEFEREITILNQATELRRLLSPENIKLLHQFNLLNKQW
ncbi:response regulator [Spirulina subsalsa FACHB-351]|uniref:histidine kinase n=1 Tax=Spirulina subsalsa FACHB-351 TaxID=234711 RepID=A0ABT3L0Z9_9CYAN|nr:response regulator [Spirulina subsalsa]MCW6035179.1 response regulator [Spirulina subsalsa FACHB-351]